MGDKMMLSEDQAVELFTFLIASARTQLDDPHHYASMRLLTAADMLRDSISERVSSDTETFLNATVEKSEQALIIMNDTDAFASALDELCTMVAHFLVEQNGLEESKT